MSSTVFVNGTVFDGHRYLGSAGPVVVHDGRIVSLGDAGTSIGTPAGARVVDLDGGLLAPGFVDAHVQLYFFFFLMG